MTRKPNGTAHPQTQPLLPPSRIEALIEKQLESMFAAVEECLRRAGKVEEGPDVWGHIRNEETADAVKLADCCAHLVEAVAKMRGRFDHNIRVERKNPGDAAAAANSVSNGHEAEDEHYRGEPAEEPLSQVSA